MKPKLFLFILLIPFLAHAQQDTLRGVVAEENEKGEIAPLIGANVHWMGTTVGAATDLNGVFSVPCRHETEELVISYVGYRPDTVKIENHEYVTIILKDAGMLKGVEVKYKKKTTEVSFIDPIQTSQINEQELFKAACCNLSESFETTPSVDVSFTDAVTGTRQIQMLGLAGGYTLVSRENIPYVRGLASNVGLSFIPGTWIKSIQLIKGTGSVVNGFEGIAGQINTELKRPEEKEKLFVNAYLNQEGRMEGNINFSNKVNPKWRTTTLLHVNGKLFKRDTNEDNFLDFPTGYAATAMNRWRFDNYRGLESEFGVSGLRSDQTGGEMNFNRNAPRDTKNGYGARIQTNRVEAFLKVGYVFPQKRYKSFGSQFSGVWHDQNSYFGLRDYEAKQYSFYSNLIYQSIIANTDHKFKTGASFQLDYFDEMLDTAAFVRNEKVPGAFFEYTYTHLDKVTIVAGLRSDYNNLYGFFFTPRLHTRFAITDKTVLRLSAGRGQRTANIIAENLGMLASSRRIRIISSNDEAGFRLNPEIAWNYGINLTQEFRLGKRSGTLTMDYYRTDFQQQVVVDIDDNPQEILFYNLSGKSYSNSVQAQVDYEPVRNLNIRLSYRWYDVKTSYTRGTLEKPLVSPHRAFVNLGYETGKTWKFDCTLQWLSRKRIPYTASNPQEYVLGNYSPDYFLLNAQVSKLFKKGIEVYVGMENITGYTQDAPILAADAPFSPYFDSALVWGPIFGRTAYAGFRFKLDTKTKKED